MAEGAGICCSPPEARWTVVLAAFIGCFIVGGVSYSCSIFYVEWLETFGESFAITSTVASLNVGLFSLIGPIASVIANRIGFRWLVLSAGLVSFIGLVVSSYSRSIYMLMFTFGIVTGCGYGLAYTPFAIISASYFPEKQALVTGLAISGMGFGSFIMPIIIEACNEAYGWRGCVLILAGLSFNICVCGALIKPLKNKQKPKESVFEFEILRSVSYLSFLLHGLLVSVGMSVMYVHLTALVEHQTHCSKLHASRFLTGFGVASFCGRIGHGMLSHVKYVHNFTQLLLAYTTSALAIFLLTVTASFWAMFVFAGLTSFMFAPYGSLSPSILSELVGVDKLTPGYGYFSLCCGIGLALGAPIAGWLHSLTGEYKFSLYFAAITVLVSVLILVPVCIKSFKKHRKELSLLKNGHSTQNTNFELDSEVLLTK